MNSLLRHGLIALLLTCLAPLSRAEQFERFGDLLVHYIVFNSTSISAEMAGRYGLTRAENVALVNISGRRMQDDGTTTAVRLELEGTVQNLVGQMRELEFKEIVEPGASYYILSTRFTDRETLRFDLQVTDTETGRTHPMRFQKELWRQ